MLEIIAAVHAAAHSQDFTRAESAPFIAEGKLDRFGLVMYAYQNLYRMSR